MERESLPVKSGNEFDHLFPPNEGKVVVIKDKGATVEDTLKLISECVRTTLDDTREIAKVLKGRTLDETCRNIWNFVFTYIKYKRDEPGKEQVRRPATTWAERHTGCDCDCMATFVSSILTNLGIPGFENRIAIYNWDRSWQHIYTVVPVNGKPLTTQSKRSDYIVIDCVKLAYNSEHPFKKIKDYNPNIPMRLEYLSGLEALDETDEIIYQIPANVDAQDIASVYDEEELGKIGKWVKKTAKKVTKGVATAVKKGVQIVKKVAASPLRNSLLLAMKVNMFNVPGRLKYGYLSPEQAKAKGLNMTMYDKVKKIKEKLETIFVKAGGEKKNLQAAILKGKGNKNKEVPLAGLGSLELAYADDIEEGIMTGRITSFSQLHGLYGLGDPASGSLLALATTVMTSMAALLKGVKGLVPAGSKEAAAFDSESEDAGEGTYVEEEFPDDFSLPEIPATSLAPQSTTVRKTSAATTSTPATQSSSAAPTPPPKEDPPKEQGLLAIIKANKGTALLIGGVVIAGVAYMVMKNNSGNSGNSGNKASRTSGGIDGLPKGRKRKKSTKKKKVSSIII